MFSKVLLGFKSPLKHTTIAFLFPDLLSHLFTTRHKFMFNDVALSSLPLIIMVGTRDVQSRDVRITYLSCLPIDRQNFTTLLNNLLECKCRINLSTDLAK